MRVDLRREADAWIASVTPHFGTTVDYDVAITSAALVLTGRADPTRPWDDTTGARIVRADVVPSIDAWSSLSLARGADGQLTGVFSALGKADVPVSGDAFIRVDAVADGAIARDARGPEFRVAIGLPFAGPYRRDVSLPWDPLVVTASEPLDETLFRNAVTLLDTTRTPQAPIAFDLGSASTQAIGFRAHALDWSAVPIATRLTIAPLRDAAQNQSSAIDAPLTWLPVPAPTTSADVDFVHVALWGTARAVATDADCDSPTCVVLGPFIYQSGGTATHGIAARLRLGTSATITVRYRVAIGEETETPGRPLGDDVKELASYETALLGADRQPQLLTLKRSVFAEDNTLPAPFTRISPWQTLTIPVEGGAGKEVGFALAGTEYTSAWLDVGPPPCPMKIVIASVTAR